MDVKSGMATMVISVCHRYGHIWPYIWAVLRTFGHGYPCFDVHAVDNHNISVINVDTKLHEENNNYLSDNYSF